MPAGWIAGALFGYVLTALAIWVPIRLGVPLAAYVHGRVGVASSALAWFVVPPACRAAASTLPPWTPPGHARARGGPRADAGDRGPAVRARAARIDATATGYYRAYFTADFVWHTALTAEIAKFASPPRNPYLAHQPIHYYWTYFLLPAARAARRRRR